MSDTPVEPLSPAPAAPMAPVVGQAAPMVPLAPIGSAPAVKPPEPGAIIDQWFAEMIQNSDVARNTLAYNAALVAKDDLKRRFAKET